MSTTSKASNLRNEPSSRKFDIGYSVITWDFIGRSLDDAFSYISRMGYGWFEGFLQHSLGSPISRHYQSYGDRGPIPVVRDIDLQRRLALYARAQTKYGLRTASIFTAWTFMNPTLWEFEREMIQALAHFLKGCEAPFLDVGGGPPERGGDHNLEEYRAFAQILEEIGRYTQQIDVRTVYHPNLSSFIEKPDQLDQLMDILNTELVGLCIDPAHFYAGGSDPMELLRTYVSYTDIVHLKDCRSDFGDLVGFDREAKFCELGEGVIDIGETIDLLIESDFKGVVIVELDHSSMSPEESCNFNTDYIENTLGLSLD